MSTKGLVIGGVALTGAIFWYIGNKLSEMEVKRQKDLNIVLKRQEEEKKQLLSLLNKTDIADLNPVANLGRGNVDVPVTGIPVNEGTVDSGTALELLKINLIGKLANQLLEKVMI